MNSAIEIEHLSVYFTGGRTTKKGNPQPSTIHAIEDLSLTVEQGTIFGFLGTNGAGKTTTIRILLGLLEPSQGKAQVFGMDSSRQGAEIREICGALMEHHGLYERLSAYENLEFYGRVWHMPTATRRQRIEELLTNLSLWERRNETVSTWSRGMKQKLAVGRAIMHRPKLIFLDEPTAGLDPQAAAALHADLIKLAKHDGVTVFLTTHNLTEAEQLCRQVGVIRQGRLMALGTPVELKTTLKNNKVIVSGSGFDETILTLIKSLNQVTFAHIEDGHLIIELASGSSTAPLVNLLVGAGVQIEEVRKEIASLEDVFLSLVEVKQ